MAREILGEFGPEKSTGPSSPKGGIMETKPLPYSPPKGPTNINDPKGPGLHGTNHGECGSQGRR